MAQDIYKLIEHGFITGKTTLTFNVGDFKNGEVHGVTAYPTDGVAGVKLQVSNIRYSKKVLPPNQWVWVMSFDLTNLSGNGVVFELYIAILD